MRAPSSTANNNWAVSAVRVHKHHDATTATASYSHAAARSVTAVFQLFLSVTSRCGWIATLLALAPNVLLPSQTVQTSALSQYGLVPSTPDIILNRPTVQSRLLAALPPSFVDNGNLWICRDDAVGHLDCLDSAYNEATTSGSNDTGLCSTDCTDTSSTADDLVLTSCNNINSVCAIVTCCPTCERTGKLLGDCMADVLGCTSNCGTMAPVPPTTSQPFTAPLFDTTVTPSHFPLEPSSVPSMTVTTMSPVIPATGSPVDTTTTTPTSAPVVVIEPSLSPSATAALPETLNPSDTGDSTSNSSTSSPTSLETSDNVPTDSPSASSTRTNSSAHGFRTGTTASSVMLISIIIAIEIGTMTMW